MYARRMFRRVRGTCFENSSIFVSDSRLQSFRGDRWSMADRESTHIPEKKDAMVADEQVG